MIECVTFYGDIKLLPKERLSDLRVEMFQHSGDLILKWVRDGIHQ
jgi:hypothetical protein